MTPASYKWLSKWPGDGGRPPLSRRMWLILALSSALKAQEIEVSNFDFSLLEEGNTPADLFFIREHFPAPTVSSAGWKLSIGGAVSIPAEISFDDLVTPAPRMLPVTIECAENPPAGGLISHAEWSGVSLASLLEKARPDAGVKFVRLSGADGFSRTIPLAKAIHADTLVAYRMNGEKLPAKHGFPLRAIIPGWYGMDSVKWLRRIDALTGPFPDEGYVRQLRSLLLGTRQAGAVSAMNVKSEFSRPQDGAILRGRNFILRGAAWAGENRVRLVEVSVDGGKSWQAARMLSQPQPYAWVHWSYPWIIKAAGEHELSVRASDDQSRRQPSARAADRADAYELNQIQTIRVTVV